MSKKRKQKKTTDSIDADSLHCRLILFTAEAYLKSAIKDGLSKEEFHRQIVSGITGYRTFRRFSKEELDILTEIGKLPEMEKLKKTEISFVIYGLELLKYAVENYQFSIGVSRKKLRAGRATFALGMIQKKRTDPEKYKELKEIIDESVLVAKGFYHITENEIAKRVKDVNNKQSV